MAPPPGGLGFHAPSNWLLTVYCCMARRLAGEKGKSKLLLQAMLLASLPSSV